MKIFCHNGISPNIELLNQYGIKVQDVFESINEWEKNAYIIELPENLKILRGKDLPQSVSSTLGNVIVDENENIISSLNLSDVNYQYESENVPDEKMYDYHCVGIAKFYIKRYPTPIQLDNMSRNDMDKFMETIEEMKLIQSEEKAKMR